MTTIRSMVVVCWIFVSLAKAGQLELDKKWIKEHMNQATSGKITFHIREAKKSVNKVDASGDDGDLHIAGASNEICLPMVAEIINGKQSPAAVKFAQNSADKDVPLNGVWRI